MQKRLSPYQLKDLKNKVDEQTLMNYFSKLSDLHDKLIAKVEEIKNIKKELETPQEKPTKEKSITKQDLVLVMRPFIEERLNEREIKRIIEPMVSGLRKYVAPSKEEIVNSLIPHIPKAEKPKDGFTPIKGINYLTTADKVELAELASRLVHIPTPQEKQIDPMKILEAIEKLPPGKKISGKLIDGYEQTISALHNQTRRGYLHGAGDTVVAGNNITITIDGQGRKIISSTGGGVTNYLTDKDGNILTDKNGNKLTVS